MKVNFQTEIVIISLLNIFSQSVLTQQLAFCINPDEKTAFLSSENYGLTDGTVTMKLGLTKDQCLNDCLHSDTCASFEFTIDGGCRLNSNTIQKGLQLSPVSGVTHFQKICLPAKTSICKSTFIREPQKILVGYAQIVYNAPTLSSCLTKCIETTTPEADFDCASLQYYYKDQQCILNSETKTSFPDLFMPENASDDEVDYVENNCFAAWTPWAAWSPCRGPGRQIRFRHCNIENKCNNGSSVEMQTCLPESIEQRPPTPVVEFATEPTIIINTPDSLEITTTTRSGCTSSYCNGDCRDFEKLGYGSYGDCLRGHFNRNTHRRRVSI